MHRLSNLACTGTCHIHKCHGPDQNTANHWHNHRRSCHIDSAHQRSPRRRKKEERKKKKVFFLCYYLFYLAKVFPLWNEVSSYVYNFNSIIKFQPQHTAQPITYDQPTFSSIRSHSPSVSNYHLTVKNHLRPLANYNRSRAVFHCC
jgi:hypothetical protein